MSDLETVPPEELDGLSEETREKISEFFDEARQQLAEETGRPIEDFEISPEDADD